MMNKHRGIRKSYSCNGDILRFYRDQKSWTQSQLARVSGYSERLISKAESGKPISVTTIKDIAQALSSESNQLQLQDLVFDPVQLAKDYVHALYTDTTNIVDKISHFLDENAVFRINGKELGLPFAGVHQGTEEIAKAFEIFFSVLEVPAGQDYHSHYKYFGNGNEVIVWGESWIHPIGKPLDVPVQITYRMRFHLGKLVEFDDRFDSELGARLLRLNNE